MVLQESADEAAVPDQQANAALPHLPDPTHQLAELESQAPAAGSMQIGITFEGSSGTPAEDKHGPLSATPAELPHPVSGAAPAKVYQAGSDVQSHPLCA